MFDCLREGYVFLSREREREVTQKFLKNLEINNLIESKQVFSID